MPREQVEFEFPDPDKEEANSQEIEVDMAEDDAPLEVEGAVGREDMKKPDNIIKAGDVEIEVEDDTPPEDRGKTPTPPQDIEEGELSEYGKKVRDRLKAISKTYHDERRAKEAIQREREALEQYARKLVEENNKLKGSVDQSHNSLIQSAKKQVASELEMAKRQYREAYDSGDSDAILDAQTALNTAQIRMEHVNSLKPKENLGLQPQQTAVQPQVNTPQPQETPRDEQAEAWREDNPWFGSDDEMTAFALGLHNKLTKNGVDPRSQEYYEQINARMRQVFPDQFDLGLEDDAPEVQTKQRSSNVVAPATRSTAPKKIRLTQSQIAIAKKLGVPLETYAKQAAELMRKQ